MRSQSAVSDRQVAIQPEDAGRAGTSGPDGYPARSWLPSSPRSAVTPRCGIAWPRARARPGGNVLAAPAREARHRPSTGPHARARPPGARPVRPLR